MNLVMTLEEVKVKKWPTWTIVLSPIMCITNALCCDCKIYFISSPQTTMTETQLQENPPFSCERLKSGQSKQITAQDIADENLKIIVELLPEQPKPSEVKHL